MNDLQGYIQTYGPDAGPKLYRAVRSRAAYKGVATRRRRALSALTGRPIRVHRPAKANSARLPLFPESAADRS